MIENIVQTLNGGYRATIDGVEWSIPNDPGNRHWQILQEAISQGTPVTTALPVGVTSQDVNAERGRRVLAGSTFVLSTGKSVKLKGDDTTKTNLQALAFAASLRIAQGAGSTRTLFRDDTDWVHELTQAEVIELWTKAAAFVSAMFQAAWFLKDGPSIPQDYKDDKYWVFE